MRIAFISYEFPPETGKGGIGTYVKQIAAALSSLSWDVHVFAGSYSPGYSQQKEGYWVHTIQCSTPHDFAYKVVDEFDNYHTIEKFDLIESAEINGNALIIKKKYPELPLVVRLHAPNYLVENLKNRYVPFFAKLRFVAGAIRRLKLDMGYWRTYHKENDRDYQFIKMANYITAPSESMKQWGVQHWGILPDKIIVIPNIFCAPDLLLNIPILKNCQYKRVVFFGRLNVLKGLVNGTKAMSKILQEYPDWKFRVIGDDGSGPSRNNSMRNFMKTELKAVLGRVEFLDGMVYDALPEAIDDSEIVLLPSLFESFSYACAEAMAAGKAIVGSLVGGMADLIQNGENGLLVDPENTNAIYLAVKKMIDDNEYRFRLSVNARKRILTDFDADKTAIVFSNYYQHIIN